MLNLLSQNPTKSHTRSTTIPNPFESPTEPLHERRHSQQDGSHVKGLSLDIPSTIPESFSPEPRKTHHRSHTENFDLIRALPPLVTKPQRRMNTADIRQLDPLAPLGSFSQSPGSSRHASPTRSRTTKLRSFIEEDTSSLPPGTFSKSPESSHVSPTRDSIKVEHGNVGGSTSSSLLDPDYTRLDHPNTDEKTKTKKLSSWFQGESQPIKVSLLPSPTKENANPIDQVTTPTRPSGVLHRKSTSQVIPAMASRFSFFNSKMSLSKPTSLSDDHSHDELAECDIKSALCPEGMPDPSSPTAFKTLHPNAEALITRLQIAYKERAIALKDTLAEKDALNEEIQGAQTRTRHLKMQLDAMAEQLAEQDRAMMAMVDELAQEKLARREEEEARKRSVRLVEREFTTSQPSRPRRSTVSDSGFESEDESSAESVFSRRDGTHSPTMSMSSVSTDNSPEIFHAREVVYSPTQAARLRIPSNAAKPVQQPCTNCHGVRPSDAWPIVGVLKEENQGLKHRIGELEGALEGCLSIVG